MNLTTRVLMAVAAAAFVALGLYQVQSQAQQIGELEAHNAKQREAIVQLGETLGEQHTRHQRELSARDAAVEAHRQEAQQAQARAANLETQFTQARSADADVDACMGMQLPDGIADSLRQ